MNKSEFVKIPFKKSVLYFTFPQFLEALQRGRAFLSQERRPRKAKMHEAAERRRDAMLGMPEVL